MSKTLAREWLWLLSSLVLGSVGAVALSLLQWPTDEDITDRVLIILLDGAALLVGLGVYVLTGLVRFTVWAVRTVHRSN